jgi:glycosyltransferase involved in cell wall biosynthesis
MSSLVLLVPGHLDTRTGGYAYDRQMVAGLRRRGWSVSVRELDGSFPLPTPAARLDAVRALAGIPDGSLVLIDGLALGAMPDEVSHESRRLRLVGLVHHPLARETGWEPHVARRFEQSERRALAAVRRVIVTSQETAEGLHRYHVSASRIDVVEPGTDPAPLARGSTGAIRHLLCVASLVPRKGHDTLLRALVQLPGSNWVLTCIGSHYYSPATVQRLCAQIEEEALDDHVRLVGEVDPATLDGYYDETDVFVLPTRHEGYGMAVAEALARGIPVVSTPTGGIADLIGRDGGILIPPDDPDALTAAIWRVLDDEGFRQRLRAGARRVRARMPDWTTQSELMAQALARVR